MANNSVLAKLAVLITAQNAEFGRAMQKSQKDLSSFVGGVKQMGGVLAAAFSIQQVADFALEVSKLAGEAEAVRAAFQRLPDSTNLMRELKQATGGTVSELDLMKRAVQASNFDISLAALPKLLEFATLRAQQTGQSVDYLVDSIVTGIGRKSKLILDNLGISAVQLNEALGDTAIGAASIGDVADAVGRIIDNNLEKMNSFMDTNSTKLQRLSASWTNLKIAIGDASNETGILGNSIDALTGSMDLLASRQLSFWEKIAAMGGGPGAAASAMLQAIKREQEQINREQRKQENIIKQVDKAFVKFKGNIDEFAKAISPNHPLRGAFLEEFKKRLIDASKVEIETLETLKNKQKELIEQFDKETSIKNEDELKQIGLKIQQYEKQIQALEALRKLEKEKEVKPKELKMVFTPDLEAEGSLNPELRNDQARNSALEFASALQEVATSAEFAGGAVVQLEQSTGELKEALKETIDLGPLVAGSIASFASELGRASVGASNFGDAILETLGGFMQSFGASLIAMGIGKIALDKFSGPGMIAAGFALTAAGAALSASINPPDVSGSGSGGSRGSSGRGMERFVAGTSVQDTSPQLVTVLKGEDVWIMLQNYQSNNRYTHG